MVFLLCRAILLWTSSIISVASLRSHIGVSSNNTHGLFSDGDAGLIGSPGAPRAGIKAWLPTQPRETAARLMAMATPMRRQQGQHPTSAQQAAPPQNKRWRMPCWPSCMSATGVTEPVAPNLKPRAIINPDGQYRTYDPSHLNVMPTLQAAYLCEQTTNLLRKKIREPFAAWITHAMRQFEGRPAYLQFNKAPPTVQVYPQFHAAAPLVAERLGEKLFERRFSSFSGCMAGYWYQDMRLSVDHLIASGFARAASQSRQAQPNTLNIVCGSSPPTHLYNRPDKYPGRPEAAGTIKLEYKQTRGNAPAMAFVNVVDPRERGGAAWKTYFGAHTSWFPGVPSTQPPNIIIDDSDDGVTCDPLPVLQGDFGRSLAPFPLTKCQQWASTDARIIKNKFPLAMKADPTDPKLPLKDILRMKRSEEKASELQIPRYALFLGGGLLANALAIEESARQVPFVFVPALMTNRIQTLKDYWTMVASAADGDWFYNPGHGNFHRTQQVYCDLVPSRDRLGNYDVKMFVFAKGRGLQHQDLKQTEKAYSDKIKVSSEQLYVGADRTQIFASDGSVHGFIEAVVDCVVTALEAR